MRRGYEAELLEEEEAAPRDLVLGAPALVGIFFAVAIVCAVCFGFGYSARNSLHLGGHVADTAASKHVPVPLGASPNAGVADTDTSGDAEESVPEASPSRGEHRGASEAGGEVQSLGPEPDSAPERQPRLAQKPAPGRSLLADVGALGGIQQNSAEQTLRETKDSEQAKQLGRPVPLSAPGAPAAAARLIAGATAGAAALPASAPALPFGEGLMVQIAAVTHAADAQTLATALRHDGFSAIVRTTTGDPLFHVQVGPFATREAAKAMRARLASVGYNAFIKN